jgi:hypothetical protein
MGRVKRPWSHAGKVEMVDGVEVVSQALPFPKYEALATYLAAGMDPGEAFNRANLGRAKQDKSRYEQHCQALLAGPYGAMILWRVSHLRKRAEQMGKPQPPTKIDGNFLLTLPEPHEVDEQWIKRQMVSTYYECRAASERATAAHILEMLGRDIGMFKSQSLVEMNVKHAGEMSTAQLKALLGKIIDIDGTEMPPQGALTAPDDAEFEPVDEEAEADE